MKYTVNNDPYYHGEGDVATLGVLGRKIDPTWWTIELFRVPSSAPQLV